jgi:hypothetical protein
MSVFFRPSDSARHRGPVGLYALGAALFAALVALIWMRMPPAPEAAQPTPPNPFADPRAGEAHIRKLAAQYGADWDRLSNDDRIFLNSIAMGHGRELLAKYARERRGDPTGGSTTPK